MYERCEHCNHVLLWRCGQLICTNGKCTAEATVLKLVPSDTLTLPSQGVPSDDREPLERERPDLAA